MAIKAVVDKIEDVAEPLRDLYKKRDDGKFQLDAEGVELEENVRGLKTALDKEKEEKRKAKEVVEKFKDIDPEEYKRLKAEEQKNKDKKLLEEGKVDELVAERTRRMREEHETKLTAETEKNKQLSSRLQTVLIDDRLRAAAAEAKVRASAVDDVLNAGRLVIRLNDSGTPVVYEGDKPAIGASGDPMTIKEWLAEQVAKRPHWFEQSAGGGADNKGGGGGGAPTGGKKRSEMNAAEKSAYIGKHGKEAFFKLPA